VKEKLSDLALSQKVEAKLMDILGVAFRNLEVRVEKGVVVLRGGVVSQAKKEECERTIAGLEGVERVESQLWVDQYHRLGP
jgi:osmotically-inducible protein OsmY